MENNFESANLKDSTSFGNISLENFNLRKEVFNGFKDNFNITFLNETKFNEFKKSINRSVTFNKLNHTPLFFETWRSHSNLINPLTIEINYNLKISSLPSTYKIIKKVPFIRNIYYNTSNDISETNLKSSEEDNIIINITTPILSPNELNSLISVNYFKGHKYIKNFTNTNEDYYGPVVVKINIVPYTETKIGLLKEMNGKENTQKEN